MTKIRAVWSFTSAAVKAGRRLGCLTALRVVLWHELGIRPDSAWDEMRRARTWRGLARNRG